MNLIRIKSQIESIPVDLLFAFFAEPEQFGIFFQYGRTDPQRLFFR